jgi:hypothetical protein
MMTINNETSADYTADAIAPLASCPLEASHWKSADHRPLPPCCDAFKRDVETLVDEPLLDFFVRNARPAELACFRRRSKQDACDTKTGWLIVVIRRPSGFIRKLTTESELPKVLVNTARGLGVFYV